MRIHDAISDLLCSEESTHRCIEHVDVPEGHYLVISVSEPWSIFAVDETRGIKTPVHVPTLARKTGFRIVDLSADVWSFPTVRWSEFPSGHQYFGIYGIQPTDQ